MPIPQPKPKEKKNNFISRCMDNSQMKKDYTDNKQRIAVCLQQINNGNKSVSIAQDVINNMNYIKCHWDEEWQEITYQIECPNEIYNEDGIVIAAEYQGKKVTLNKPFRTPDGPKKFSVYVTNDKGNVVKVNFGDPNMKIKKNIPERRKSFRARHNCSNPGPKWKARYWSCKAW